MKQVFVFASNNKHKLEEVRQILSCDVEVWSLAQIGFKQGIDETGLTLEENSQQKASAIWQWLLSQPNLLEDIQGVFADDTGLEILALGGRPGVRTARWAGETSDDAANRRKALEELEGVSDRRAQFRTVVTLITQEGQVQVEGVVKGRITNQEEGEGGFGYDPVFVPEGYENTFASLPAKVKNQISHRARAIEELRKHSIKS
jgi:XTP/dITP diphosphohydrolase